MKTPLVSIITPVYNGEAYLSECIDSVLAQTYDNWDYTIVNNCSTDCTLEIARKYAAADSRIHVHNNETFVSAIANHNLAFGLISSQSKYAKAVFADDWIFPECLERMVKVAEEHPTIGIVGAYGLRGKTVIWNGLPYPSTFVPGREVCRLRFLEGIYAFGGPTAHLVRSDLIRRRNPLYDETNIHADTEMCITLMQESDFGFVHQVLSYTRDRPDSLTSSAEHFCTLITGELYDLVKFGRKVLAPAEFDQCFDHHLWSFYNLLASGILQRREREFWEYQKSQMAKLGLTLEWIRLMRAVAAILADVLCNPKLSIEQLMSGQSNPEVSRRVSYRPFCGRRKATAVLGKTEGFMLDDFAGGSRQ